MKKKEKVKEKKKSEKPSKGAQHNLHDFAKAIAEDSDDLGTNEVHKVLQKFVGAVASTILDGGLEPGDSINLPSIGKLVVTMRGARNARNPSTGETIKLAARPAVKFRLSGPLRLYGKPSKEEKKAKKKKG